ncbi:hypothetical protein ACH4VX_09490 [Streptomyces sp. NPDC020731]|uniref:hypothetical protein n=1 Tax=Streptomyces sp. NPDC020731 TaxID=3365085 RepID=UPI0037886BB1
MKRLLLGVAVVGLVLGASVPAQAHDTDDWIKISGWSGLSNSRATGWVSYPASGEQADGWGRVDWSGGNVEVHAGARDLVNDGWCAVTEVRYKVKTGGSWADHWHYRSPAVDCDIDDGQVISSYYKSRYPTKDVHFRVCLGWRDGTTFQCSGWK